MSTTRSWIVSLSWGTFPVLGVFPRALVERFVSPFQVKLLVAGKVEAKRAAVQMVWDAGSNRPVPGVVDVACGSTACPALRALPWKSPAKDGRDGSERLSKTAPSGGRD